LPARSSHGCGKSKTVLMAGVAEILQDLMHIENFR
jgi:hypothetical protein